MNDEILARGADYSDILLDAARELDRRSWIPVTERLPEDGVPVAIVADRGRTPDNRGVVAAGELYRGCWYHTLPGLVSRQIADVTHWMPLPAPPEDAK